MMYGSVLSGALAGHVYGTAAYDVTSTGEPDGWRPHIWTALRYESGGQMQHLRSFVLSEGARFQQLTLASQDLAPRSNPESPADGLDGWSFLMRTPARDFALAYFENRAVRPRLAGFTPQANYRWYWFEPRSGEWSRERTVRADAQGVIQAPAFPDGGNQAASDIAAKVRSRTELTCARARGGRRSAECLPRLTRPSLPTSSCLTMRSAGSESCVNQSDCRGYCSLPLSGRSAPHGPRLSKLRRLQPRAATRHPSRKSSSPDRASSRTRRVSRTR
jgi:hypothetical protein